MDSSRRGAAPQTHTDMKHPKRPEQLNSSFPPKSQEGQFEEDDDKEERRATSGHRTKRERRQGSVSATVCQVCNIQLNSGAQAQIHYKGKTHQRRLRRLAKAVSTGALSQRQVHPLLGSLPLSGRPLQQQTHAQLEHFLPIRVSSPTPLSLFPNFNTMDPVQKAVINHTFGVAPPKKKTVISCNICHLRFNSTTQAEAHYKGHKHARKLRALETQKNRQRNGHAPLTPGKDREKEKGMMGGSAAPSDSDLKEGRSTPSQPEQLQLENGQGSSLASSQSSSTDSTSLHSPQQSPRASPTSTLSVEGCSPAPTPAPDLQGTSTGGEEEVVKVAVKEAKTNKKQHLHCPTCKVTVNSRSQLEAHCSGSKHKQMLDGQKCSQSHRRVKMASSPRQTCRIKQRMGSKSRAVVGVSNQPFHCKLCQVSVNSETQLKQHMNSRRHKERLAGKPIKSKFTPYNKIQPGALLATKLALQKHLSKTLPAGFLTTPLNPATLCTMATGPLALRLPQGPTTVIQAPLISPSLFRPAPGPLRASHAPIIFSPY